MLKENFAHRSTFDNPGPDLAQAYITEQAFNRRTNSQLAKTTENSLEAYARTGDPRCLRDIFLRYHDELTLTAKRVVGEHYASDVVQDVFLKLTKHPPDYNPSMSSERSYLHMITLRAAIDKYRRIAITDRSTVSVEQLVHFGPGDEILPFQLNSKEPGPVQHLIADEDRARILQLIGELSDPQREIIDLVYFKNMKYREVAEALEIPIGTVKSRINNAKLALKELYEHTSNGASKRCA